MRVIIDSGEGVVRRLTGASFVVAIADLRMCEVFLATSFALLAENISNTVQRGSGILRSVATVCTAWDLGAGANWVAFVLLLRVFRMVN